MGVGNDLYAGNWPRDTVDGAPLVKRWMLVLSLAARSVAAHRGRTLVVALSMASGTTVLAGLMSVVRGMELHWLAEIAQSGGMNTGKAVAYDEDWHGGGVEWRDCIDWIDAGVSEDEGAMVAMSLDGLDVRGVTESYCTFGVLEVEEGRFLGPWDQVSRSRTCVLGHDLAETIPGEVIGSTFYIAGQGFQVVGRLSPARGFTMASRKPSFDWKNHAVLIPLTVAVESFPDNLRKLELYVRLDDDGKPVRPFPAREGAPLALKTNLESMESFRAEFKRAMPAAWVLIWVCVALASIGVSNVVMSGVTERVREIGIQRSVGASPGDILLQFIAEATLCGFLGALIGYGLSESLIRAVVSIVGLPRAVSPLGIAMCFSVGPVCGMLAGLLPAIKARRIDPAQALRTE